MAANGNKKLVVCPITIQEGWDELAREDRCAIAESLKSQGYTGVKVQEGGIITWTDYEGTKRQAFNEQARDFIAAFDECIGLDNDGKFIIKDDAELPEADWSLTIRERDVIKVLMTSEERVAQRAKRVKNQRKSGTRKVTTQVVGGEEAATKRTKIQSTTKSKARRSRIDGRTLSVLNR